MLVTTTMATSRFVSSQMWARFFPFETPLSTADYHRCHRRFLRCYSRRFCRTVCILGRFDGCRITRCFCIFQDLFGFIQSVQGGLDKIKGAQRILGDSDFVESVLDQANETFERFNELKRLGMDIEVLCAIVRLCRWYGALLVISDKLVTFRQ